MYLGTSLMHLYDETTKECERVFRSLPSEAQVRPIATHFMPMDIPAHLMQSEALAIGFIAEQAQVGGHTFTLHPALIDILRIADPGKRAAALKEANFRGARDLGAKFESYDALLEAWLAKRAKARVILDRISDTQMNFPASHPLVTLEGTVFHVAMKLLVVHAAYHMGQFTQSMKHGGAADVVPFPFGRMDAEIPAVVERYMSTIQAA